MRKSHLSNSRHRVRYVDGCKGGASIVFVYSCVSISSKLNGRKVMRKYMRIAEKIKI